MALGSELVRAWAGALIDRHQAPDRVARLEGGREWVALQCWHGKDWLFITWHADSPGLCRMAPHRMADLKSAGESPCSLLLALRAHIGGARFVRAEQWGHDRVLELFFERSIGAGICRGRSLVLECAGRYSNLALRDEGGIIVDAAKHVHPDMNRYRSLLPGHPYVPPPPMEGFTPEETSWIDEAPSSLTHMIGFGRPFLAHVARHWQTLPRDRWVQALREGFFAPHRGIVQELGKGYLTQFPFLLPEGTEISEDLLNASQRVVAAPMRLRILQTGLRFLRQEAESVAHRLAREEEGFAHKELLFGQADQRRVWGDLLLSHAPRVEEALAMRATSIALSLWESEAPPEEIPLDPERSVAANAQNCYRMYRKWKAYGQDLEKERRALEARRHDVEEQMAVLDAVEDIQVLRSLLEISRPGPSTKKRRPAPPHLRYDLAGGRVYVGLNAPGNRYVTFEIASGDDLWCHAQNVPGAHVIAQVEDEGQRDVLVHFAASLAAAYSRAKGSLSVAVDVTERRQVRHVPGQGVAFVTYHRFRTVRVSPSYWRSVPYAVVGKGPS